MDRTGWKDELSVEQRSEIAGGGVLLEDRRELEERLRETESRFRTMADCAPVLLWMAGTDAHCNFFNQTWLDFSGRSLEEEMGIGWAEGVHPEDFQGCMDTYVAAFNARRAFKMEYRLRRHDGEYRWILDEGVPRYTPNGTFAGYIGSCVDITERIEAERERKVLVARLQEALRIRDQFISIASHELRTPLTALRLQTQRLVRMTAEGAPAQEPLRLRKLAETSNHLIDRLSKLIDDMLDISVLSKNEMRLELREVDLGELVGQVIARFADDLSAARCTLQLDAAPGVVGTWDPFRLEQILINLLTNVIKYAAGAPVQVSVAADGARAKLVVSDRGRGITREAQGRIFECFERAARPEDVSGLGLGLYIVSQIARAHGGSASVESQLGDGATFVVHLPLAAPLADGA